MSLYYAGLNNEGYIQAKRAFTDALAKRDKKAVEALLNDNFKWVEWNGEERTKAQVLANLDPLAKNYEGQIDVRTTDFLDSVLSPTYQWLHTGAFPATQSPVSLLLGFPCKVRRPFPSKGVAILCGSQ